MNLRIQRVALVLSGMFLSAVLGAYGFQARGAHAETKPAGQYAVQPDATERNAIRAIVSDLEEITVKARASHAIPKDHGFQWDFQRGFWIESVAVIDSSK